MKLTLAESRLLKDPISIMAELVNEVSLKFDQDKLEVIAMDPANVAMVIFRLLSSACIEYSIDEPVTLGINLESFRQILKRAKPADIITLALEENKLRIELSGESTRVFHISLLNLEKQQHKIPELNFPATIEASSAVLNDAIEDMDIVADAVLFTAESNKFSIEAAGNTSKAKIELPKNDELKIQMAKEGKLKSKYSIEYLKKMMKASKLTPTSLLSFSQDYPLKLQYKILDKLDLEFILAPRVQND